MTRILGTAQEQLGAVEEHLASLGLLATLHGYLEKASDGRGLGLGGAPRPRENE